MSEQWRAIEGFTGLYEVSDQGRVKSLDRVIAHNPDRSAERRVGRVLKPATAGKGYLFVNLYRNGKKESHYVHRLVASAFLPASNAPHVNHKDLDKKHNAVRNLEWATPLENTHHWLVGDAGLSASEASDRVQAMHKARKKRPAIRHPKVKPCAVCGELFSPPAKKRATQQSCSAACGSVMSGWTRRKPESTRFAKYTQPASGSSQTN